MSGKTEAISIRRGLSLYKQPQRHGRGSPNWYARVYMPKNGRLIHAKSTGTTDVRIAKKKAEAFWDECRFGLWSAPTLPPSVPNERRFDRVAEHFLDTKKREAGSDPKKLRGWKDDNQIYMAVNGLAKFFGKDDIGSINTSRIRDFLIFNREKSVRGDLAINTQKRATVTLRLIIKSALERGLVATIPLMPKLQTKDNPRPNLSRKEYRLLYVKAWVLARQARARGDRVGYDHWMEMSDFVIFMVSTYLRSSEWAALQNRHVTIVGGEHPHIQIAAVRGKTGPRTVRSQPEAIAVYRRMLRRCGDPDAYLFKSRYLNRQTATERMYDSFEALLKATNLKLDAFGKRRVVHCLRHTAITFGIMDGVGHLLLAKNAGTGIDQIQRFYASRLEVGMMLGELHRRAGK